MILIKTRFWTALLMGTCSASPAEDAFARSFIEHVRLRDSAGFQQLEPGPVRDRGWQPIAALSRFLPQGALDSVRLTTSESVRDKNGKSRKLTYLLYSRTQSSRAEVWLASRGDRYYVHMIQVAGPVTRDR